MTIPGHPIRVAAGIRTERRRSPHSKKLVRSHISASAVRPREARCRQLSVLCNLRMRPVMGDDIARRYALATSAAGTGVKPVK